MDRACAIAPVDLSAPSAHFITPTSDVRDDIKSFRRYGMAVGAKRLRSVDGVTATGAEPVEEAEMHKKNRQSIFFWSREHAYTSTERSAA